MEAWRESVGSWKDHDTRQFFTTPPRALEANASDAGPGTRPPGPPPGRGPPRRSDLYFCGLLMEEEPRRGSLPGLGAKAPGIGGAAATATDHEGWRQAPAAPSGGQRPLRAWA